MFNRTLNFPKIYLHLHRYYHKGARVSPSTAYKSSPSNAKVITFPTHHYLFFAMTTPLPIHCSNCRIKQLDCNATSHIKGSCIHYYANGLECLFPSPTIPHHGLLSNGNNPFQRNCLPCTQRHQKCMFDNNYPSPCK